jgi:hypothetical protein
MPGININWKEHREWPLALFKSRQSLLTNVTIVLNGMVIICFVASSSLNLNENQMNIDIRDLEEVLDQELGLLNCLYDIFCIRCLDHRKHSVHSPVKEYEIVLER